MNLSRHATVLWRFRRVTAAGIVLGIVLAILASYRVTSHGLQSRGTATWSAVSSILVTQPGFPEGRVTLPEAQLDQGLTTDGQPAVEKNSTPSEQLQFADPGRLAALGDLYSKFLTSDDVLSRVPEHPTSASVLASPFASAQGGQVLPVVQLTTMGPSAAVAQRVNLHVYKGLLDFLDERAKANNIPRAGRVELKLLSAPEVTLVSGVKPTMSVLALMLVLLATLAVTHLLELLRTRRQSEAALAAIDWDAPVPDVQEHRKGRASAPAELAGRRNR
jgi:hypothetical protein